MTDKGTINASDLIRAEEVKVRVEVLGERENFGRTDLLIRPVEGTGQAWVRKDKVTWEDGQ